ncbi:hypothetical protein H2248_005971 [Termitomyces sp. 'cryptogamus']|nr:hypothetical protein H2248_005971 [Termitomyces sp. 'cryptogamus']
MLATVFFWSPAWRLGSIGAHHHGLMQRGWDILAGHGAFGGALPWGVQMGGAKVKVGRPAQERGWSSVPRGRFFTKGFWIVNVGEGMVGGKVIISGEGLGSSLDMGLRLKLSGLIPSVEGIGDRVCLGASREGQSVSSGLVEEVLSRVEGLKNVGCGIELLLLAGNGGWSFTSYFDRFFSLHVEGMGRV